MKNLCFGPILTRHTVRLILINSSSDPAKSRAEVHAGLQNSKEGSIAETPAGALVHLERTMEPTKNFATSQIQFPLCAQEETPESHVA